MSPFHFLGEDDQNEIEHHIFGHVMPMALSVEPLHLFSQHNQNAVQHDFF